VIGGKCEHVSGAEDGQYPSALRDRDVDRAVRILVQRVGEEQRTVSVDERPGVSRACTQAQQAQGQYDDCRPAGDARSVGVCFDLRSEMSPSQNQGRAR
jgi:hypothetical protein